LNAYPQERPRTGGVMVLSSCPDLGGRLVRVAAAAGFATLCCARPELALDRLGGGAGPRILVHALPTLEEAVDLLLEEAAARFGDGRVHLLLVAGALDAGRAVDLMRHGCVDIVRQSAPDREIVAALVRAAERQRRVTETPCALPDTRALDRLARQARSLLTSLETLREAAGGAQPVPGTFTQPVPGTPTPAGPGTLTQPAPGALMQAAPGALTQAAPGAVAGMIQGVIKARQARERLFGDNLFADPVWDMLLDLYAHHLNGQQVTVSSLCIAARTPQATALRRLDAMVAAGLVEKIRDPDDARRLFVRLTPWALDRFDRYLAEYGLTV